MSPKTSCEAKWTDTSAGPAAICYKVGERAWLAIREQARQRLGEGFDLKAFHSRALSLGPMGLAQLEREMAWV